MDDATRVLRLWAQRSDRAVIFDFNGTLSDDEPVLLRIFAELFDEHLGWRLAPEVYASELAGLSDREIIERVVAEQAPGQLALVETMLEQRRLRYRDLVQTAPPVRDDTRALLRRLRGVGVPMAVVTGAQRADVDLVLAYGGVAQAFAGVVTVEDVAHGKPHPEGFLTGARVLGVDPAAVLVFEDTVAGARGARAAGMRVIGVEGGGSTPRDLAAAADAVVPALRSALLDDVPGCSAADSGLHDDACAVGAEEVEGVLDRQAGRGVCGALDEHQR
jgi:beta-phosphoglucomutase